MVNAGHGPLGNPWGQKSKWQADNSPEPKGQEDTTVASSVLNHRGIRLTFGTACVEFIIRDHRVYQSGRLTASLRVPTPFWVFNDNSHFYICLIRLL